MDSSLDPNFTTHLLYASIVFLLNISGAVMLLGLLIGTSMGVEVRNRYKAIYLIITIGLAVRAVQQLGTIIGYNIYDGNGIFWSLIKDLGIYLWIACNLVDYQKSIKLKKEAEQNGGCPLNRRKEDKGTGFHSLS